MRECAGGVCGYVCGCGRGEHVEARRRLTKSRLPDDHASRKRDSDATDARSMSGLPPRLAQIEISTFSVLWPTFEAQNAKDNPAFHQSFPDFDLLDKVTHPTGCCRKLEGWVDTSGLGAHFDEGMPP